MKVGILTYHFSDNYGALMQAYSLREWFRQRGHVADFVNYHPKYVEQGGALDQVFNPANIRKNLVIGYLRLSCLYRNIFGSKAQKGAFERFKRVHLGVVGPRFFEREDIQHAQKFDLLVCGSDQIWNPSTQKGLDPVYFLDFPGAESARRISYAASFGKDSLGGEYLPLASRLLSNLDDISVREASGVDIVKVASGRDAVCVPDPTILNSNFDGLIDRKGGEDRPHIFCYALRTDSLVREAADAISADMRLQVVNPRSSGQRWRPIGVGVDAGPLEWLQLLYDGRFVVSNSFHGVALSIVLNRPFIAVALPGKKGALNERVLNLLKQTGLTDRFVCDQNLGEVGAISRRPVDWGYVNSRLLELREIGAGFLTAQLDRVVA